MSGDRRMLSRASTACRRRSIRPFPLAAADVLLRDAARPANRRRDGQGLNERSPAGEPCPLRNKAFLKGGGRAKIKAHASKTLSLGSKIALFLYVPSKTLYYA